MNPSHTRCRVIVASLVCALALAGCRDQPLADALVLATTTSVGNSGLLDALAQRLEQDHRVQLRSHLVGSGRALRMLEQAQADVVISHAPEAEAAALDAHPGWRYQKIMFNDFVLVGPATDPAKLKTAADVSEAMRRLAASDVRFISRGDRSGTHEREEALWQRAAVRPPAERLIAAGGGMGATLRIASETGAYTLTDRATLAQLADSVRVAIVCEGGAELLNTYAVIFDPAGPKAGDAQVFFEWITTGAGRIAIAAYRIKGTPAFLPWPPERIGDHPNALPR